MQEPYELEVGPYLPKPLIGHQLPLPSLDDTCHPGRHLATISWSLSGQNHEKGSIIDLGLKRGTSMKKVQFVLIILA
jgi:hypothetical protein